MRNPCGRNQLLYRNADNAQSKITDMLEIGKRMYRGRVKSLCERIGINKYISHAYWFMISLSAEQVLVLNKNGRKSRMAVHADGTISSYPEREVIEDVLASMTDEDVFLDVGANFGRYCCVVSSLYGGVDIIAVEPNPSTASILRRNIENNGLNGDVFEYALSDSEGDMTLSMADFPERSHLDTSGNTESDDSITVQVKRGDMFVQENGLPTPTVVKIDVEGAELGVITGMEDTLKKPECRLLYCEVHPFLMKKFGSTEDELFTKLTELGFDYDIISEREVEYEDGEELQKFIKAEK